MEIIRKTIPSNYQIFDYWKDKTINDDMVVHDWGEPSCWSCNKSITVETDQLLENGDFKTIWNKTSGLLERCHIVPKSLGGSYEPENIFLMCPECHAKAPNTNNRDVFLNWVNFQRENCMFGINTQETINSTVDICNSMNVDIGDLLKFIKNGDLSLPDNISTHGSQINYSTVLMSFINKYQLSKQQST